MEIVACVGVEENLLIFDVVVKRSVIKKNNIENAVLAASNKRRKKIWLEKEKICLQ